MSLVFSRLLFRSVFGPSLDPSWHHVVFNTQGGTVLQLYVDGALASSATMSARPSFSANAVIGWTDATWMAKFPGRSEERRVGQECSSGGWDDAYNDGSERARK